MKKKFWLVWNPTGSNPQYRHENFESAKQEAKRLAVIYPGNEFVVMESLGTVIKNEAIWRDHHEEMDIPF